MLKALIGIAIALGLLSVANAAQSDAMIVAKSYGFSEAEFQQIKGGAILWKDLPEKSDRELAGVVAVFLKNPIADLFPVFLEGKLLKSDETIKMLQVWKPDSLPDNAFSPGTTRETIAVLKSRYEDYRKSGLKGVGRPGEQLALAIKEALPATRWAEFSKAVLNYPADQFSGIDHRFFCYQQIIDGQPACIQSLRSGERKEHSALITEQRYYVSRTYDCRFIATECIELPGGTMLFYVNCLFTDQVAGVGSGLRHNIGRKRMLSAVVEDWKYHRDALQK